MAHRRGGPGGAFLTEKPRIKNAKATVRRLWGYLRREQRSIILIALIVIVATAITVIGPYLMGRAIDDGIEQRDMDALARIVGLLFVLWTFSGFLNWASGWLMVKVAQRTVRSLRNDLFVKLQSLPIRFFDQRPHGETMSRLTNDVENVNQVLSESLVQIISGLLMAAGIMVVMFLLEPLLAVVAVTTTLALTFVINKVISKHTSTGFRAQQKHLGTLNGSIEETITGQRVIKAYNQEAEVTARFEVQNQELRQAAIHAQTWAGYVGPLMNFVGNTSLLLVAFTGGWLVLDDAMTVGTLAAFVSYTRQFGRPISEIANMFNQLQSAIAGAERVFEVLDEEPEVDAIAAPPAEIEGDVRLVDVSFSYDGTTPILKHVSAHAEPGQLVALVGPTGAGKSTIINLLTRFYEIDSGEVLLDGRDLRTIEKANLRQHLGVVLQDTFLFAGTVRENIRYGKLDATDEEIEAAAKLANAHQFIMRHPQGYDAELTERGGNLSQGQRQLIAIARAAISDPKILILDEATSSVDTRTERHIQEALLRLMQGRTSFVIAHRLSTIRSADQILVINHGEIVEHGRHEELIEAGGFYARLHNSQFRGDDELARQEELAQIEEAEILAIANERD